MKKYDFIGVQEQGIHGINNPMFYLKATVEIKEYEIEILMDGIKIPE